MVDVDGTRPALSSPTPARETVSPLKTQRERLGLTKLIGSVKRIYVPRPEVGSRLRLKSLAPTRAATCFQATPFDELTTLQVSTRARVRAALDKKQAWINASSPRLAAAAPLSLGRQTTWRTAGTR